MRPFFAGLFFVTLLVPVTGCQTHPPAATAERIVLQISRSGEIQCEGRTVAPEKLEKVLRSRGGDPAQTEILLSIKQKVSPEALAPAVAAIRVAGYSKMVIVTPRRASASATQKP